VLYFTGAVVYLRFTYFCTFCCFLNLLLHFFMLLLSYGCTCEVYICINAVLIFIWRKDFYAVIINVNAHVTIHCISILS